MDKIAKDWNIDPTISTIFLGVILMLILAAGIMFVIRSQKKRLRHLKETERHQGKIDRELLESKFEIQQQAFKNISREIHDNIGQVLSLVKITINTMDKDNQELLLDKISTASELISQAIQDLRDLSRSLHVDAVTEMGLLSSIEYELELIKKTGRYQTNLVKEGTHQRLSHKHELILFRIFQEALNNVLKHSKASEINMKVNYNSANFIMHISDNGIGFDAANLNYKTAENAGAGITNIANRASLIGAGVDIVSEEGRGTTITIDLPLK